MSAPVAIAIGSVFVVTLAGLTLVVVALVRHMKQLTASMAEIKRTIEPQLAELQRETAAAQHQLERLSGERAGPGGGPARLH